ncbi:hypothetical protein FLL45_02690 [Aliikangiella marina]|uniref:Tetrapyrrole methylase domain-containing protein n=2 Tax=Aliikangiella marina TaxID=1712262 RepID=A0A545TK54_9GAMM|nr:hypothetical protein FLL45_02690 [Aliikangiella marina]
MMLGAHITPAAKDHILNADVCFLAASDSLVELWIKELHPNVRSLQSYYASNKSRKDTYREMIEVVLSEVFAGKRVCGIFYGHPGVFAYAPHEIVKRIRAKGGKAIMEPGISAEDCLIADLGLDPGKYGCQQFEASQFLFYDRMIDPSATLILWQIALVGDLSFGCEATSSQCRQVLLEELYKIYPENHKVTLYEAMTLPIGEPRIDVIPLSSLVDVKLNDYTTLVVPPLSKMKRNIKIIEKLKRIHSK